MLHDVHIQGHTERATKASRQIVIAPPIQALRALAPHRWQVGKLSEIIEIEQIDGEKSVHPGACILIDTDDEEALRRLFLIRNQLPDHTLLVATTIDACSVFISRYGAVTAAHAIGIHALTSREFWNNLSIAVLSP